MLDDRCFDATIDACAYWPGQVRSLASALDGHGGHYVCISSASAYADTSTRGGDESLPLASIDTGDPDSLPMGADTYGPLKVLCEEAAAEEFGASGSVIVRPTYVVGPYDHTGRFTWWVDWISRGGVVACPGPADNPMQLIDARDQASWVVGLVEQRIPGAFHSCSPEPPWSFGDMLAGIRSALGADAEFRWLDPAAVASAPFPMWTLGAEGVLALSPAAARATGLSPRPFAETVRDTSAWMATADWRRDCVGVEPNGEVRLIAASTGA